MNESISKNCVPYVSLLNTGKSLHKCKFTYVIVYVHVSFFCVFNYFQWYFGRCDQKVWFFLIFKKYFSNIVYKL